jgi:threonine synthase
MTGLKELAAGEGIFAAPEGGAAFIAYRKLTQNGFLGDSDRVVLFNTGSGYKYVDLIAKYWKVPPFALPASRSLGGIIGPN